MVKLISLTNWIEKNEIFLKPPVSNKLIFDEQLKVFIVKGPNSRRDFHINNGEEIFFMLKGEMLLKVIYNNECKDIIIEEGHLFILPAGIPHSPQRFPETLGMVIERRREENELDGIRFYDDNFQEVLFEKWFKCNKLDQDLVPILNEFKDNKTSKKLEKGSVFTWNTCKTFKPPVKMKSLFDHLLTRNEKEALMTCKESTIVFFNSGKHVIDNNCYSDIFLWHHGSSAEVEGNYMMDNDCMILNKKSSFVLTNEGPTLMVKMSLFK